VVQDSYNIIPVTLAVLLHAIVFGSLFVAFDLSREAAPPMPLLITATLVSEDTVAPPVREPEPEPEPEPEIEQPDPEELARSREEEQKRLDDARREQDRLDDIKRKEAERKAEEARERRRKELEEQRLADIAQQRQDNLLEQQRIEREAREAMIAAEDAQMEAQNSTEAQVYQAQIIQKVRRNWARPGTARDDLECVVAVEQVSGGVVVSARVIECNGDEIVRRSVENAVHKASPLPQPSNQLLFLRRFQITFTIDD